MRLDGGGDGSDVGDDVDDDLDDACDDGDDDGDDLPFREVLSRWNLPAGDVFSPLLVSATERRRNSRNSSSFRVFGR